MKISKESPDTDSMIEIDETFKSFSFESTITRILDLLNYELEFMKNEGQAKFEKLKTRLFNCKQKLEQ